MLRGLTFASVMVVVSAGCQPADFLEVGETTRELAGCDKTITVHIRHDGQFSNPADHTGTKPNGCWSWERTAPSGAEWGYCDTNKPYAIRAPVTGTGYWYYDETRPDRVTVDRRAIDACFKKWGPVKGVAYMIPLKVQGNTTWSTGPATQIRKNYAEAYSEKIWGIWKKWRTGRPMINVTFKTGSAVYTYVKGKCRDRFASGALVVPSGSDLGIYMSQNNSFPTGSANMENFIKALNDCTDTVYNVQFSCGDECTPGAMRCNGGASEQCGDYDGDACFEWGGAEACGADGSGDVCLDDGTCGEPGVCSNDCASGQKRCTGDWSDNCGQFDGDACLDWGNGEDCRNYGADYHCDPGSGACVYAPPACTDECSSVQKRCSGDWSENCGNYDTSDACLEWGGAEWCPNYGADYHCDPGSGACVNSPGCTDECGAGAKRCIGDWSDNCGYYDGDACLDWGNGEWCPNYGADFHCDPGSGYCVYAPPPPPPPTCDCTVPAVQGCTGWACDEWGCWPVGGSQYCIANGGPNECGNWGCCWDGSSCI